VYVTVVPEVALKLPLPVVGEIDQVKVQEVVMVVAAVLKALAVKDCDVAVPTVPVAVAGDILTEDNTVVVVPVMVTAVVEAYAFPAVSLTEDEGVTVVVPTTKVGEVPRVT